jgi:hypothetical protein
MEYSNEIPFGESGPAPAPRGFEGRGRPRLHAIPEVNAPASRQPQYDPEPLEYAGDIEPRTSPPQLHAGQNEIAEVMDLSRAGEIQWKSHPKSAIRSVNPSGVELPHPDVFSAKLPDGRNVRVWERKTPDVTAGALVRRIFSSGTGEEWVTTVGVEIHDSGGMLTYRLTGLRGQNRFREVVELFDEAARDQTRVPASPPAVAAVRATLPAVSAPAPPPLLTAELAEPPPLSQPPLPAPRPLSDMPTPLESTPPMPMTMPPPPMTEMEPSYWQQERAELIEELSMWRRECLAARLALEEMRKLISVTRTKSGPRLFKKHDRNDPPLTRTY